jgi:hypothetical protein
MVGVIMDDTQPPKEILDQCKEINVQWLSSDDATVEPYWHSSDFADEWCFRVTHRYGSISYLSTKHADGHTYHMMVSSIYEAHKKGVKQGKAEAVHSLMGAIIKTIGS